ncbi:MAG: alanine--tRNA ligase-related protein [Pseudomonadota bacterium]
MAAGAGAGRPDGPGLSGARPHRALIAETLRLEETRFKQTLERGLHLLADETAKLASGQALAGEVRVHALRHVRLSARSDPDVLRGQGRGVDLPGFETAMAAQRAKARAAWAGSGEAATESLWFELREQLGASEFLGYATERAEGQITTLVVDGKSVEQAGAGTAVSLIANQTPFYGESGGQMGDAGVADRSARQRHRAGHREKTRRPDRPCRHGRGGHRQGRRAAHARGSTASGARGLRANHSATPSAARGAAPARRRACRPEGLAGRARSAALRHQPSQAADRRRAPRRRARGQSAGARQQRGHDPADDADRCGRGRRAGVVRREIRRRGARRRDGP